MATKSNRKGAEKSAHLFYVVYRTGNPEACTWQRTEPMVRDEAEQKAKVFEGDNIKALVVDKKMSDVVGLPEGWEYKKKGDW